MPDLEPASATTRIGQATWTAAAGFILTMVLAAFSPYGLLQLHAELLPGNIWPNPTLEADANHDGTPDFWHRGGSDVSMDVWSTNLAVSPGHSFQLLDSQSSGYGEWYSDTLAITPNTVWDLRYNLRYIVTNTGPMRVSVNFYGGNGALLSGLSYAFAGAHDFWEELTQEFQTPAAAKKVGLTFTSGGGLDVTGEAWLDDVSLAARTNINSLVPYIESFPALPHPLVIRDWKQTARDYAQVAFDSSLSGSFLPLIYNYNVSTAAGYSGPAFGLPSYVGNPPGSGEALSALGAVLGGTLAGLDMASFAGQNRVQQCEAFYCLVNGHGLVLNNINSAGSGSGWYDIFPSALFYEIGARYPGHPSFRTKMQAIADSWLAALPTLSNNWDHTGFDFKTMAPSNLAWNEPDMAIGIAWIEYMAYLQFGDPKYLTAADLCLGQMETRSANPFYEILACFGPPLAARMNAEMGRAYSTSRYLNWIFSPGSDARSGWGCEAGRWGDFDAYGLIGSTTDSGGYAFSMNSYAAAGIIAPVARYEPKYSRLLGRWLLHVAGNANLFYPATLPATMQASAMWVGQTGVQSISYEGVRHLSVTTPYATGDAMSPVQELNPYGAWGSGWLAALFQTSNVPGILRVDCVASDVLAAAAYPTHLLYNPYPSAQEVIYNPGSGTNHLYDAVLGVFVATNITGQVRLSIPADTAMVVVECPATGALSHAEGELSLGGVPIDYWNAARDSDGDGLPDWWESRYFANPTNAQPTAAALNGFDNEQCYRLGLDPTDPRSTFQVRILPSTGTGQPQITWNAIGGKTYAVEFADGLGSETFTQALKLTATNAPAGVERVETFVDTYTLTGGPPGTNGRAYRIECIAP